MPDQTALPASDSDVCSDDQFARDGGSYDFVLELPVSNTFQPPLTRCVVRDRIWTRIYPHDIVAIHEYRVHKQIGYGAYARVHKAENTILNLPVVLRMVERTRPGRRYATQEEADRFLWTTACIMDRLQHPNLTQLYEVIYNSVIKPTGVQQTALAKDTGRGGRLTVGTICGGLADKLLGVTKLLIKECTVSLRVQAKMPLEQITTEMVNGIFQMGRLMAPRFESYENKTNPFRQCLSTISYDNMFIYVLEYCNLGDLTSNLGALTTNDLRIIVYQVASGLEFLHRNNILHQDVKADNVFINTTDEVQPATSHYGVSFEGLETPGVPSLMSPSNYIKENLSRPNIGVTPSSESRAVRSRIHRLSTIRTVDRARTSIVGSHSELPLNFEGSIHWTQRLLLQFPLLSSISFKDSDLGEDRARELHYYYSHLFSLSQRSPSFVVELEHKLQRGRINSFRYVAKLGDFDTAKDLGKVGDSISYILAVLVRIARRFISHLISLVDGALRQAGPHRRLSDNPPMMASALYETSREPAIRAFIDEVYSAFYKSRLEERPGHSIQMIHSHSQHQALGQSHTGDVSDTLPPVHTCAPLPEHVSRSRTCDLSDSTTAPVLQSVSEISNIQQDDELTPSPEATLESLGKATHPGIDPVNNSEARKSSTPWNKTSESVTDGRSDSRGRRPDDEPKTLNPEKRCAYTILPSSSLRQTYPQLTTTSHTRVSELGGESRTSSDYTMISEPSDHGSPSWQGSDALPSVPSIVQMKHSILSPARAETPGPARSKEAAGHFVRQLLRTIGSSPITHLHDFIYIIELADQTLDRAGMGSDFDRIILSVTEEFEKVCHNPLATSNVSLYIGGDDGTRTYLAPEVLRIWDVNQLSDKNSYMGKPADVWQFGVMLYSLYTGSHRTQPLSRASGEATTLAGALSPFLTDLFCGLLASNPMYRYTMYEVLNHPFFDENNFPVAGKHTAIGSVSHYPRDSPVAPSTIAESEDNETFSGSLNDVTLVASNASEFAPATRGMALGSSYRTCLAPLHCISLHSNETLTLACTNSRLRMFHFWRILLMRDNVIRKNRPFIRRSSISNYECTLRRRFRNVGATYKLRFMNTRFITEFLYCDASTEEVPRENAKDTNSPLNHFDQLYAKSGYPPFQADSGGTRSSFSIRPSQLSTSSMGGSMGKDGAARSPTMHYHCSCQHSHLQHYHSLSMSQPLDLLNFVACKTCFDMIPGEIYKTLSILPHKDHFLTPESRSSLTSSTRSGGLRALSPCLDLQVDLKNVTLSAHAAAPELLDVFLSSDLPVVARDGSDTSLILNRRIRESEYLHMKFVLHCAHNSPVLLVHMLRSLHFNFFLESIASLTYGVDVYSLGRHHWFTTLINDTFSTSSQVSPDIPSGVHGQQSSTAFAAPPRIPMYASRPTITANVSDSTRAPTSKASSRLTLTSQMAKVYTSNASEICNTMETTADEDSLQATMNQIMAVSSPCRSPHNSIIDNDDMAIKSATVGGVLKPTTKGLEPLDRDGLKSSAHANPDKGYRAADANSIWSEIMEVITDEDESEGFNDGRGRAQGLKARPPIVTTGPIDPGSFRIQPLSEIDDSIITGMSLSESIQAKSNSAANYVRIEPALGREGRSILTLDGGPRTPLQLPPDKFGNNSFSCYVRNQRSDNNSEDNITAFRGCPDGLVNRGGLTILALHKLLAERVRLSTKLTSKVSMVTSYEQPLVRRGGTQDARWADKCGRSFRSSVQNGTFTAQYSQMETLSRIQSTLASSSSNDAPLTISLQREEEGNTLAELIRSLATSTEDLQGSRNVEREGDRPTGAVKKRRIAPRNELRISCAPSKLGESSPATTSMVSSIPMSEPAPSETPATPLHPHSLKRIIADISGLTLTDEQLNQVEFTYDTSL
ncbi:Kinase [Giardia muris]|uniref:non-specific serine/threonine protein kinase n=1 Tax=Giardia muris TaxID=5742 RepID=A0A4Z1SNS7_GIAMU|nr:Kinase [Giardia muris]|eukprot:TNJ27464.1 Kinase [Giardia muris]